MNNLAILSYGDAIKYYDDMKTITLTRIQSIQDILNNKQLFQPTDDFIALADVLIADWNNVIKSCDEHIVMIRDMMNKE